MDDSYELIRSGNGIHVKHGDDSGLHVEFSLEPIEDPEQSKLQGRPIFRDVEMISIRIKGDKNTHVMRMVDKKGNSQNPPDHIRFPRQWEAFKNKSHIPTTGTPITEWSPVSKSMAMNLKSLNIHTVEDLATVNDSHLHNIGMGARDLREKAKIFIESAKDSAVISQVQAENQEMRDKIAYLEKQISILASQKQKAGRPKKEVEDDADAIGISATGV